MKLGFLFETDSELAELRKKWKEKGVELDAYESSHRPQLSLSRIVSSQKGKGHGTAAMKDLIAYADKAKKTILLSPSKDFGASSVSRLKDFYKRFGFVENKGRYKDFSISDTMYRLPKGTEIESNMKTESSYTSDTAAEETLRKILRAAAKNESASITIEGKTGPALSSAHCKAIAEFYEIVQAPQNIAKKAQFIQIFGNLKMFVGMLKSPLFKQAVARYVEAEKAVQAEPVTKAVPPSNKDVYTKPGRQASKSEFEPFDLPTKKKSEFEPLDIPVKKKTGFTDFKSFMKTSPETYFSDKKVDPLTAAAAIKTYRDVAKRGTNEEVISEQWDDSAAKDAEGRWAKYRDGEIGLTAMAKWLYSSRVHKSTRADKLKSAYGAIAQQQNTSKLISASKADALRAELKKLYPVKS